jgi:hypothetical protein
VSPRSGTSSGAREAMVRASPQPPMTFPGFSPDILIHRI